MADHVRKQIRDAIVTLVTGLTTTGSNVFAGRTYALQDSELPALRVYTGDEDLTIAALGVNRTSGRAL